MRGINAVMYVRYTHLSDRYSRVTHVIISISVYVSTHSRGSAMVTIIITTAVSPSLPWRWEEGKKIASALLALCSPSLSFALCLPPPHSFSLTHNHLCIYFILCKLVPLKASSFLLPHMGDLLALYP